MAEFLRNWPFNDGSDFRGIYPQAFCGDDEAKILNVVGVQ